MHFAVISYAVCLTRGQQAIYLFFPCSNTNPLKKNKLYLMTIRNFKTWISLVVEPPIWKNMIVKLDHSPKTDLKINNLWIFETTT